MFELTQNFDDLYRSCHSSKSFKITDLAAATHKELMQKVPKVRGVYLIWRKPQSRPLYIGSSGKLQKGLKLSNQTIWHRLRGSSTPYKLDAKTHHFSHGPTTPCVPPNNYNYKIILSEIQISVIATEDNIAPAALEHLLIQGYINQYKDLPDCNQKI